MPFPQLSPPAASDSKNFSEKSRILLGFFVVLWLLGLLIKIEGQQQRPCPEINPRAHESFVESPMRFSLRQTCCGHPARCPSRPPSNRDQRWRGRGMHHRHRRPHTQRSKPPGHPRTRSRCHPRRARLYRPRPDFRRYDATHAPRNDPPNHSAKRRLDRGGHRLRMGCSIWRTRLPLRRILRCLTPTIISWLLSNPNADPGAPGLKSLQSLHGLTPAARHASDN